MVFHPLQDEQNHCDVGVQNDKNSNQWKLNVEPCLNRIIGLHSLCDLPHFQYATRAAANLYHIPQRENTIFVDQNWGAVALCSAVMQPPRKAKGHQYGPIHHWETQMAVIVKLQAILFNATN